jgi:hypothetical protein
MTQGQGRPRAWDLYSARSAELPGPAASAAETNAGQRLVPTWRPRGGVFRLSRIERSTHIKHYMTILSR